MAPAFLNPHEAGFETGGDELIAVNRRARDVERGLFIRGRIPVLTRSAERSKVILNLR